MKGKVERKKNNSARFKLFLFIYFYSFKHFTAFFPVCSFFFCPYTFTHLCDSSCLLSFFPLLLLFMFILLLFVFFFFLLFPSCFLFITFFSSFLILQTLYSLFLPLPFSSFPFPLFPFLLFLTFFTFFLIFSHNFHFLFFTNYLLSVFPFGLLVFTFLSHFSISPLLYLSSLLTFLLFSFRIVFTNYYSSFFLPLFSFWPFFFLSLTDYLRIYSFLCCLSSFFIPSLLFLFNLLPFFALHFVHILTIINYFLRLIFVLSLSMSYFFCPSLSYLSYFRLHSPYSPLYSSYFTIFQSFLIRFFIYLYFSAISDSLFFSFIH